MLIINTLSYYFTPVFTILSVLKLVDLVFTTNRLLNLSDFFDVSK